KRLAQLVQQPRILDRNNGLCGETRHQLDLLVGERLNLLPVNGDGTNDLLILEHRHTDKSARAAKLCMEVRMLPASGGGRLQVSNLDHVFLLKDVTQDEASVVGMHHRLPTQIVLIRGRRTVCCANAESIALA